MLFAYYDYMLAANIQLKNRWRDERCEIDLFGDFDGVGWGPVRVFAGCPARRVGSFPGTSVFVKGAASGPIEVTLDYVGSFADRDLGFISLSANGKSIHATTEVVDQHLTRLRA